MRGKLAIVLIPVLLVVLLAGCGKDRVVKPDNPGSSSGISDANGNITMDVNPYTIKIRVENESAVPVPGISVSAYLLHEYLLTVAASVAGTYYPAVLMTSFQDAQSSRRPDVYGYSNGISSAQSGASTELNIVMVVKYAGLASYGYDIEPEYVDLIEADTWIETTSRNIDLNSFYLLTDSIDYQGGMFVHLSQTVSSTIGAGRQTAAFQTSNISDFPTFSSLMGIELRIFSEDTLQTKSMTYQGNSLPVLLVDDISMVRNFWAQITLTWDENPQDLDSHLWTPSIEGNAYHIYFASRGDVELAPYVDLDVDDVTSYGPEHITIWNEFAGVYTYAIYHYSGTGVVSTSGAEIGVLKPDGTVQNFTVPQTTASANWWWHVCTIDGTTGTVTPINIISADPPLPFQAPETNIKQPVN